MLPTALKVVACLPRQIQRTLPVCIAGVLLVLYASIAGSFEGSGDLSYRTTLATGQFPRKIWQTWKVDPLDFEERDLTRARTWIVKNPGHRYEVLTDQNDLYYVETMFGPAGLNRPDIVYMYRTLTAKIIKADLLRYLVMYAEGGVYTDIDVEALKPVDRFIPDRYNERDIDMIIGVEVDEPDFSEHAILGKKSRSFCQWTFVCKPRLPVMLRLVEDIMHWINTVAEEQKKSISDIQLDFDEVITGTGPSAFTSAVLAEMSARTGQTVRWDTFHNMGESKLVGGVLVLTVEAFAAGQGHSDSGNHNTRSALVKHHYHASMWPTSHPRYNHPMYGEVERCNWELECVRTWDSNVATFDSLPEDVRVKQIALKEAREAVETELAKVELAKADLERAQQAQPELPQPPQFPPPQFPQGELSQAEPPPAEFPPMEFPPAEFPPAGLPPQ